MIRSFRIDACNCPQAAHNPIDILLSHCKHRRSFAEQVKSVELIHAIALTFRRVGTGFAHIPQAHIPNYQSIRVQNDSAAESVA